MLIMPGYTRCSCQCPCLCARNAYTLNITLVFIRRLPSSKPLISVIGYVEINLLPIIDFTVRHLHIRPLIHICTISRLD